MAEDDKFVELIFDPGPITPLRFGVARESLIRRPQQLFDLLIKKEVSTAFVSGIVTYGKQLAALFKNFPGHQSSPPEDHWKFVKKGFSDGLLEEAFRSFLFLLLANGFPDFRSQQAVADIVMAVIMLSKKWAWGLIREKLGETPGVLKVLIADGRINILCLDEPGFLETVGSGPVTFGAWVRIITELVMECDVHHDRDVCQRMLRWEDIRRVICGLSNCCRVGSRDDTEEDDSQVDFNPNPRTFESLLGIHLGCWKMLLSAQALKDLTDSVRTSDFAQIRTKLLEIAAGKWNPRSLVKPRKSYQVPVFKTFYKMYGVILWQVDVAFDERYYCNYQVVKVWAIGTHEQIENTRAYIIRTQQAYSATKTAHCKDSCIGRSTAQAMPQAVRLDRELDDEGRVSTATINYKMIEGSPMLSKFYSLTTTVLETIASRAPIAAFPLDVSEEEVHIIDHFKTPTFIIGRSGTGKTTCLIYKLTSRYLSSIKEEEIPVRQLLLTRSKRLARKLKLYTRRLIGTQVGEIDEDPREVDDGGGGDGDGVLDDTEEDTTQEFLSLNQRDFPLVCTFSYFLRLLENTIRASGHGDGLFFQHYHNRRTGRSFRQTLQPIDLNTFNANYWKRFPTSLKKGIPVELAFVEIMGVIKGSATLASNFEPLSRNEYLGKRWRVAPNFATSNEREKVYSLYEHYERIKSSNLEADNTDRVIRVMKSLQKNPELQRRVERLLDEIYVDEVQDQRPLEIELLLSLTRDPRGIHFAGDTAQAISNDALFRFSNAKALFYTRFHDYTLDYIPYDDTLLKPTLLPLTKNFRSHQGILSLAALIMELLYTGFPNLVDKLPREIGELYGPKPTLCVGSNMLTLLLEAATPQPTSSDGHDVEPPDLGELRVIIVRDKETQKELQDKVKRFALVLTILQSKGMEFEDVFLYNFFTTSSYHADFAILEKLLHERHSGEGEPHRYADWEKAHIALCSELKNLYVGVTRVRSQLWILESGSKAVDSVISLVNRTAPELFPKYYPEPLMDVVREHEFETARLRERFQSTNKTTRAQLIELAYEFMTNGDFKEASFCFRKAKAKNGENMAEAYLAEQKGMEYQASGSKEDSDLAFTAACALFLEVKRASKAVGCQEAMGNFAAAAKIWSQTGEHEKAAQLFIKAKDHKMAAEEYHKHGAHEKALAAHFHGRQYNEMARYLLGCGACISLSSRLQYSQLCYRLLIEEKISEQLQAPIIASLGSAKQQEIVFRRFGMLNHLFWLHKKQERYNEAYKIGIRIGFLKESLELLVESGLLKSLDWAYIFDYLQAEIRVTRNQSASGPRSGKSNRLLQHRDIIAVLNNTSDKYSKVSSVDKFWKAVDVALNDYPKSDIRPKRGSTYAQDEQMKVRVFLDLLVTSRIPESKADLTQLPLQFIDGAMDVLQTISSDEILPPTVQLYLGIFETQSQPHNYIALQWSPLCVDRRFPPFIKPLDAETVRRGGYKQVLSMISQSLEFINKYCNPNSVASPAKKLTKLQFSTNLQAMISVSLLLLKLETVLSSSTFQRDDPNPVMTRWSFWPRSFLRQMTFVSSYEQDAEALVDIKRQLESMASLHKLYSKIQNIHLSEVESGVPRAAALHFSSLLEQIQVATFLDIEGKCATAMEFAAKRQGQGKGPGFRLALNAVALVRKLQTETRRGDFPGLFCENIRHFISKMEELQSRTDQISFYSSSVLSLYEEILTLLIFLIRPTEVLVPRSWEKLHLPKWARTPRSTSKQEIWWYQRALVKLVINFCELIINIETRASSKLEKTHSLARRSLNLLVISIINTGTLKPPPSGYGIMWEKVQEVFSLSNLQAADIKNIPAHGLIEKLAQAFNFYNGKDVLTVHFTESIDSYNLLARLVQAGRYKGVIVTQHHSAPRPRARHLGFSSLNFEARKINAAYLITQYWRTNRPRLLQRRAYLERQPQQIPINFHMHNCCMLSKMKYGKNWIY